MFTTRRAVFLFVLVFAFVCLFTFTCGADTSVIIYNNLDSLTSGTDPVSPAWGPLADSFTTPSWPFSLTQVAVLLYGSPSAGSFTVSLLSDNTGSPSAVLSVIGTMSDSGNTAPPTYYYVAFGFVDSPIALDPRTRYWIALFPNPTNGSTAQWAHSLDQSAPGVAEEYYANFGKTSQWRVWPNSGGPYQMQIGGMGASPEPSSLLLLGTGVFVLVGFKRAWAGFFHR